MTQNRKSQIFYQIAAAALKSGLDPAGFAQICGPGLARVPAFV